MSKILLILVPAILAVAVLVVYISKQNPVSPVTISIPPTIIETITPTVATPIPTEIEGVFYKNIMYNFTLLFPDTWQNYKATTYQAQDPNNRSICFSIPSSSPEELPICIMQINIFTQQEWSGMAKKPLYITENSKYVFAYDYSPDCVQHSSFQCSRAKEVPSIISSFTFAN